MVVAPTESVRGAIAILDVAGSSSAVATAAAGSAVGDAARAVSGLASHGQVSLLT